MKRRSKFRKKTDNLVVAKIIIAIILAFVLIPVIHNSLRLVTKTNTVISLSQLNHTQQTILAAYGICLGHTKGVELNCKDTDTIPQNYINTFSDHCNLVKAEADKLFLELGGKTHKNIREKLEVDALQKFSQLFNMAIEKIGKDNPNQTTKEIKEEYCKFLNSNELGIAQATLDDYKKSLPEYYHYFKGN